MVGKDDYFLSHTDKFKETFFSGNKSFNSSNIERLSGIDHSYAWNLRNGVCEFVGKVNEFIKQQKILH